MSEYIKLEDAVRVINGQNSFTMSRENIIDQLNAIPSADAAQVAHGRWEFLGPNRLIKECLCGTCSVCKVRSKYIVNPALCPNCGAKMYGGADHA